MIKIKSEKRSFGINFPSEVEELTPEYFNTITANVKLPKYHCIVALCFKTKVYDFVLAMNSAKPTNVAVVPVLAKISETDSKEINAEVGDKIIIDRSSLERGNHINLKTVISSDNAKRYFSSDPDLIKNIVNKTGDINILDSKKNKKLSVTDSPKIIVLEFKIVPINDIAGAVSMNSVDIDPFIITDGVVS